MGRRGNGYSAIVIKLGIRDLADGRAPEALVTSGDWGCLPFAFKSGGDPDSAL